MMRVKAHHHLLAEEWERRRPSTDARRFEALLALLGFGQLAQDPVGFLDDRGVDVPQRHPARRTYRQALGAHHEADGAPLAAGELERHAGIAQKQFARGAGMNEARGVSASASGMAGR